MLPFHSGMQGCALIPVCRVGIQVRSEKQLRHSEIAFLCGSVEAAAPKLVRGVLRGIIQQEANHLQVPALHSCAEHIPPIQVHPRQVRLRFEEYSNGLEVAFLGRGMKGRAVLSVRAIEVRSSPDQKTHCIGLIPACSDKERRATPIVRATESP